MIESRYILIRLGFYLEKSTVLVFCGEGQSIMRYRGILCIMMVQKLVHKLFRDSIKCKYSQQRYRQNLI